MAIDKKRLIYRLKFYGFGFGLGIIAVWATLYNQRDARPSWTPQGRVLEFLEKTDIAVNEKLKCDIECAKLPQNFMDSTFWANAEVDFDKSATRKKPCPEHYISSRLKDGRKIAVFIENCETCFDCDGEGIARLISIEDDLIVDEKTCDC